jgi:hypothetical protein
MARGTAQRSKEWGLEWPVELHKEVRGEGVGMARETVQSSERWVGGMARGTAQREKRVVGSVAGLVSRRRAYRPFRE